MGLVRHLLILLLFGLVIAGGAVVTWQARGQAQLLEGALTRAPGRCSPKSAATRAELAVPAQLPAALGPGHRLALTGGRNRFRVHHELSVAAPGRA